MSDNETGGSDLGELLKHMMPNLRPEEYVFLCFPSSAYGDQPELQPVATFVEEEGLTLVVPRELADQHQHSYTSVFRCITLQVHSSLEAVGLTAAFATQLTRYSISANVIAGFHHDHIFVGTNDASKAIDALHELSANA